MTEIAILTPDPADVSYAGLWPGVLDRLGVALSSAGITTVPTAWVDHVGSADGLARFPLVLPLIAWGYHRDHHRWMQACATWQASGVPIANPASVLNWNSDKTYLRRLAERGIDIPPTAYLERVTPADVEAAFDRFSTDSLIVKPTVSGGAWRTQRVTRGDGMVEAADGAAMIQPYLPTIESEGELSLLFFGGRLSHAVRKRPVAGEFRIQVQFGGLYETVAEPPAQALALADQVFAAVEEDLLYARIDMVREGAGQWLLMEAELIEPDFYLGSAPDDGAAFAVAVRDRLDRA